MPEAITEVTEDSCPYPREVVEQVWQLAQVVPGE
jgi:hypothetical protein